MKFLILVSLVSFSSFAQTGENPVLLSFRRQCSSLSDKDAKPVKALARLKENCERTQEAEFNLTVVFGLAENFRRECLKELGGKGSEACYRIEGQFVGLYKGITSDVCTTPAAASGHVPPPAK